MTTLYDQFIYKNGAWRQLGGGGDSGSIPTKTSDLTNDSGFITLSDVPEEAFIATYGTTSYNDILTAYNAGKLIFCKNGTNFAPLEKYSSNTFYFAQSDGTSLYIYQRNSSGWSTASTSFVEQVRKINNKALSSDINLTASDVGALPSSTSIPSKTSDLTNDSGFITASDVPEEIYIAVMGTTTYANVLSAYNAGKTIFVDLGSSNSNKRTPLTSYSSNTFQFLWIESSKMKWVNLISSGWSAISQSSTFVLSNTTVNGKALSSNITLDASDVGALPSNTSIPSKTSDLTNDSGFITSADVPEGSTASTTTPKMDGTAAVGTETAFARGDHIHPSDTSKLGTSGNGSNVTVAFTQASSRTNIATGGTLATAFSRISKWFADLGSLAFKSTVAKTDLESSVQTSLGKADTALQSFTETDPTVPSWAKASSKPTYTATEVGALPANTSIPSKTSDLTNDSGFITSSDIPTPSGVVYYGYCETAAATAQKEITITNFPTTLTAGISVRVKFKYKNTAASPTLKINTLTATSIYLYRGNSTQAATTQSWGDGNVVDFVYDGDYWIIASATLGGNTFASSTTATTSGDIYVPNKTSSTGIEMDLVKATKTPGANYIAKYDANSRLSSTTPTAGDNSTLVATTAFVTTAITNATAGLMYLPTFVAIYGTTTIQEIQNAILNDGAVVVAAWQDSGGIVYPVPFTGYDSNNGLGIFSTINSSGSFVKLTINESTNEWSYTITPLATTTYVDTAITNAITDAIGGSY